MVDPITTGAIKVAADVGDALDDAARGLLVRLLGPSADVIGQHWASALANRVSNVRRVVELADVRTAGHGAVPLRVADAVFNTAQYADSEFVAEYLSGVLASSRSEDGRDDRGVAWTSLIAQLSSDQVRLHYALYAAAREVIATHSRAKTDSEMCNVQCFVPFEELDTAMGWGSERGGPRFREAAYGLQRQGVLGTVSHGTGAFLAKSYSAISLPNSGGLIYRARIPGLMMYLWGLGSGGEPATLLLNPKLDITPLGLGVPAIPNSRFIGHVP